MLSDIWLYLGELRSNSAAIIWQVDLVLMVVALVLRRQQYYRIFDFLDRYVSEDRRVSLLRTLLVLALLISGFSAWEGRYRGMVNEWKPQIEQRDTTITKLQDENKRITAQSQDNANQRAKQFDDRIKTCRNAYAALLNEITNLNSESGRSLDEMAQLRQQFHQQTAGLPGVPPATDAMAFRNLAWKFQDRWRNSCK